MLAHAQPRTMLLMDYGSFVLIFLGFIRPSCTGHSTPMKGVFTCTRPFLQRYVCSVYLSICPALPISGFCAFTNLCPSWFQNLLATGALEV